MVRCAAKRIRKISKKRTARNRINRYESSKRYDRFRFYMNSNKRERGTKYRELGLRSCRFTHLLVCCAYVWRCDCVWRCGRDDNKRKMNLWCLSSLFHFSLCFVFFIYFDFFGAGKRKEKEGVRWWCYIKDIDSRMLTDPLKHGEAGRPVKESMAVHKAWT